VAAEGPQLLLSASFGPKKTRGATNFVERPRSAVGLPSRRA
jgi:hypothetical protein